MTAGVPPKCTAIESQAFVNCVHLAKLVAPLGIGDQVCYNCPLLPRPDYITEHSPAAVLAAHNLEYWSASTHTLCEPAQRQWVRFVLLVLARLGLPLVVRPIVLEAMKRQHLCRI